VVEINKNKLFIFVAIIPAKPLAIYFVMLKWAGFLLSMPNNLSNISYYRLKAYWYPYRDLSDPDEKFKESISFEKALNIYVFDRKLKIILFDAIERIEIALRTKLVYYFTANHTHCHTCVGRYLLTK
jgi:Abi-like protein